ncbi:hypothetical protein GCM10017600_76590 [Streptosporangium carneum]|uniref:Uncharacterized protein n=1 Tax=Streptosporangium carneum TaxID=47481 RepID=A0A9W6MHJ4_9ACTN|nr:hypothetical protein GCM10017600_76590 [Streptosporangium carneum]
MRGPSANPGVPVVLHADPTPAPRRRAEPAPDTGQGGRHPRSALAHRDGVSRLPDLAADYTQSSEHP